VASTFIASSVALLHWNWRIERRKTTRSAASIVFANRVVLLQERVSRMGHRLTLFRMPFERVTTGDDIRNSW